MARDSNTHGGEGLDTIVDATSADEGLETALSTVFVEDGARATDLPGDAGGTTTILVPDDAGAPRPRRAPSSPSRRVVLAALGAALVLLLLVGAVLSALLRALVTDPSVAVDGAPAAPAEPPAPASAAEGVHEAPTGREEVRAVARCSYVPTGGGRGSLTIACELSNPRTTAVRATVVPVVYHGDVPDRVHHEALILAPGERTVRRYELRGRSERDVGGGCACEVSSQP